ncbi:MAG: hypothetical protein WAU60_06860 [Candidatus Competibacter denitrificans]|jgi:Ser/Thr protein kinase RdoA (MazF antagonist)
MSEPSERYRVGDEHPATVKQSPPTESRHIPIVWLVTHDLERRAAEGRVKYGTLLRGFNGREALTDAYQEALDLAMYLRQLMYEQSALAAENTRLKSEIVQLRALLDQRADDLK